MRKLVHPRVLGRSGAVRALRAALEGHPAVVARHGPGFRERFSAQGKAPGKTQMAAAWRAAGKAIGKVDRAAMPQSAATPCSRGTP